MRNPRAELMRGERYAEGEILSDAERQIYLKAREKESLRLEEFQDVPELSGQIQKDNRWLEKQRNRPEERKKTARSQILEEVIREQTELADWLGPNAMTAETTEYDDRLAHIDFVVEWEDNDGEIVRLGVDVTTSQDDGVIADKQEFIRKELDNVELAKIKYFQSEVDGSRGSINQVPRVTVAVDHETVTKLSEDVVNKNPKEMAESSEQFLILEQIKLQMIHQIEYSLGLLMDSLSASQENLDQDTNEELLAFAQVALELEESPESVLSILNNLESQNKLLEYINANMKWQKRLEVINVHKSVLETTSNLIKEKSDLMPEVAKQAAERGQDNIIIVTTSHKLQNFNLPSTLTA